MSCTMGIFVQSGSHPLGGEVAISRPRGLGPTFGHPGFGRMALPRVRPVRACTGGTASARKEKKVCVCVCEREREGGRKEIKEKESEKTKKKKEWRKNW